MMPGLRRGKGAKSLPHCRLKFFRKEAEHGGHRLVVIRFAEPFLPGYIGNLNIDVSPPMRRRLVFPIRPGLKIAYFLLALPVRPDYSSGSFDFSAFFAFGNGARFQDPAVGGRSV
jgi:hypothetical protein